MCYHLPPSSICSSWVLLSVDTIPHLPYKFGFYCLKMAEQLSLEQETVQYYQWLMRIERTEFEKELLDIISISSKFNQILDV